jgi:ubiquinone/menaquinone biosynthesis C-methylase UbiE
MPDPEPTRASTGGASSPFSCTQNRLAICGPLRSREIVSLMTTDLERIRAYWELNTPQHWYSAKQPGTREFYEELQHHRYGFAYPYLLELGEFDRHAGERVLEIGCGQGTDLLQFAKGGAKVWGIDLTDAAVEKTRAMLASYGYDAEITRDNCERLERFESESFDVVYSFGVLHHTPDTEGAIEEVRRVLKPGGVALIMLYAKGLNYLVRLGYFHVAKRKFLKQSLQDTINQNMEHRGGCPLAKMYTPSEALRMFARWGHTRIVRIHSYHANKWLPRKISEPLGRHVGDNLFIRATK